MIEDAGLLFAELATLFLGVSFVLALLQRWLGQDRIRRWMGGPPVVAALKGIGLGFVTPFCTYSAIPVLVGLRQARVRAAGSVAFIVAAPVLDPILFGALVLIVGPGPAAIYVAVAFLAALGLALVAEAAGIERLMKPIPVGLTGSQAGACPTAELGWRGWHREWRDAARSAATLLRTMLPLLVVGVAIGLVISAAIPPEAAARVGLLSGSAGIPVAAALGTPLYFSTELFVPIAGALGSAGVGVGAVVALTIAGAGANLPEFAILSRLANRRLLVIFAGYVFAVAVTGGMLAQLLAA